MGLYKQPRSKYWWIRYPGGHRESTKIPHTGSSSQRTKDLKLAALQVYEATVLAQRGAAPLVPIAFAKLVDWYTLHCAVLKRGAEREGWALQALTNAFGPQMVSTLDEPAIIEWRATRAREVAAGTVNRELAVLKAVLKAAVPRHLKASPAAKVTNLRPLRGDRTSDRRPRILTPAEETRILSVMDKPIDRALFLVALCTLARLGDLLDLRWEDVRASAVVIRDPKSGRAYDVPLSKRAKAALEAVPKTGIYVFSRFRGGTAAERRNRVKMWLHRKCERAKVPYGRASGGITFHSLRHTGASRMVDGGVDLRTVQEIGGWSSLRMVERYSHPTPKAKRAAVERI